MAAHSGIESWRTVRPPLMRLTAAEVAALTSALDRLAFSPQPLD